MPGQEVSPTEERVYDAFGRAVQIVRDGEVLDRVYVGAEVVREVTDCAERVWWPSGALDAPGAYTLHWGRGCTRQQLGDAPYETQLALADLDEGLKLPVWNALESADGATYAVLVDLHGDVVGLVDEAGAVAETYHYDVHGARTVYGDVGDVLCEAALGVPCGSGYGNPRGYVGRFHSSLTGQIDLRARHYDPMLRLFMTPDPMGFVDGFDVWQLAGGDPWNFVDPFGLNRESEHAPETERQSETVPDFVNRSTSWDAAPSLRRPARELTVFEETVILGGVGKLVNSAAPVVGAADDVIVGIPPLVAAGRAGKAPKGLGGANKPKIDTRKLTEYALNPNHPVGGNKARVFESALGYNQSNYKGLLEQIQKGVMKYPRVPAKVDKFGTRFTVDIPVTGPKGSATVRTGWIVKPGSTTPELTTLFVK